MRSSDVALSFSASCSQALKKEPKPSSLTVRSARQKHSLQKLRDSGPQTQAGTKFYKHEARENSVTSAKKRWVLWDFLVLDEQSLNL
ncbi:uncharacterized [Tachysurus ichikawai]